MLLAREIHRDQKRKYTGNPYFDHLAELDEMKCAGPLLRDLAYSQV